MSGEQVKVNDTKVGPWAFRELTDHGETVALHSSRPCSHLSVSGDGKADRQVGQSRFGMVVDGSGSEEVDRV